MALFRAQKREKVVNLVAQVRPWKSNWDVRLKPVFRICVGRTWFCHIQNWK